MEELTGEPTDVALPPREAEVDAASLEEGGDTEEAGGSAEVEARERDAGQEEEEEEEGTVEVGGAAEDEAEETPDGSTDLGEGAPALLGDAGAENTEEQEMEDAGSSAVTIVENNPADEADAATDAADALSDPNAGDADAANDDQERSLEEDSALTPRDPVVAASSAAAAKPVDPTETAGGDTAAPPPTNADQSVWHKVYLHMEKARVKPIALFRAIDTDESGSISSKELRAGLKRIVDVELTDDEFKSVLKIVDKDRSNDINYKELSRAIKYGNPQRKASINAIQKNTKKKKTKKKQPVAAPKSPASPTPSNMSSASTLTNFKVPTGIASIDREGYKQEQFMQALLVPSRVRRKSKRAREQMLRDFSLSSTLSSTMASTIELAGPALRESGFCRSPTNRDNPNPDLGGADAPIDAEHVRAQRSRRRAERAKAADENWSEWKQEKAKEIADRKRRKKEREDAKAARIEAKKVAGKAAYEAWKQNEKRRRKEKRRARKEAEAAAAEKVRQGEVLAAKVKEKKRAEREKQQQLLAKIHARQAKADAAVSQEVEAIEALARRRNRELKKKLKKLLSTPYTDPTTLSLIRGRTPGGSNKRDKVAPAWLLPPKVAKIAGLQSKGARSIKDVGPLAPGGSGGAARRRKRTKKGPAENSGSDAAGTEVPRGGRKQPLPQISAGEEEDPEETHESAGHIRIDAAAAEELEKRPPWNGNEYRAKSRQGLGEAGDDDLYLQPPKYVAPRTPNGTQLRRGAGGGLLRPLQKKNLKKKGISLLRFSLEEVSRPTIEVMDDLAVLLVNGCKPSSLRITCQEVNTDGSGALTVDELKSCIGIVKPRLRGDVQVDNLLDELGAGNGMFGAAAAIKYELLVEALERAIQARGGQGRRRRAKKKTPSGRGSKKAVGLYGKEVSSPLESASLGPARSSSSTRMRRRQRPEDEGATAVRDSENAIEGGSSGSRRRPVTDIAHDMYNANAEDEVRSALRLKQRGASRGGLIEQQESGVVISGKDSTGSCGRPSTPLTQQRAGGGAAAMSQLPPSGSKSKLKNGQRLEAQNMPGGIVSRKADAQNLPSKSETSANNNGGKKIKDPVSPAWIRRAEQRQASEQRRRKREEAERIKQRAGGGANVAASVPRVPSGALEGLQPELLREACLAKEKPPLLVMRVLGAMCLLLGENPTWLVARKLIVDSNDDEGSAAGSAVPLVERLRNLDVSSVNEKTLHRLRRVVEHAGPNFSPEHFRSLESPHLSAFAPLCEYVLTAFDMAQLLFDDKWNNVGVAGGLSGEGGDLGDEAMRGAARKAIKERREADRAKERHRKAVSKAKKEQDEADEAQRRAEEVLNQAKTARAAAKEAQDAAQKELDEVQAVKQRLVQQREEAEADGQIDEEEEEAHNVLVRSMFREQQEAIQAKSKADLAMLEAEQLEEAARRSLEEAKIEQAEAKAAMKKANKMARLADREEREAAEARDATRKAMQDAKDREKGREIANLKAIEKIAEGEAAEERKLREEEEERAVHHAELEKLHLKRAKEKEDMIKAMNSLEEKEARIASMLPPGPPPPVNKTFGRGGDHRLHHHHHHNHDHHKKKDERDSGKNEREESTLQRQASHGNNNDDDEHATLESASPTSPSPTRSRSEFDAKSPPRSDSPSKRQQKLMERRKRSFKKNGTSYIFSENGSSIVDAENPDVVLDFGQHVVNLDSSLSLLFSSLDANHDGSLSKLEVVRGVMRPDVADILRKTPALAPLAHPRAWSGAFHSMDTDQNGKVSLDELQAFALGMYAVGHGGGDVAVMTELAAHAGSVTGSVRSLGGLTSPMRDGAFAAGMASPKADDVHKTNQVAVQAAISKIFGLVPTMTAVEAAEKDATMGSVSPVGGGGGGGGDGGGDGGGGGGDDGGGGGNDGSTLVVSKRVLIRKLGSDVKVRTIVEDCPQLRVLRSESSYAAALILLKTSHAADHISMRELNQFVCGLIAGQIGVSRRVDKARQFQRRIKDQLNRLYAELGMPDGKRLVGRRFSRVQSKPFLLALEKFAVAVRDNGDGNFAGAATGFELIAEFVSRPNVMRQLHHLLGGQFWLAKRSVEIACIGYYACRDGYKDAGTKKSRTTYKEHMLELSSYDKASPDESLIDAIGTLFGECIEDEDVVSGGAWGGLSSALKIDVLRALSKPKVRQRLAPCQEARSLFDTERYWSGLQALETQNSSQAAINQFEMLCFTFGMGCCDLKDSNMAGKGARPMTPELSGSTAALRFNRQYAHQIGTCSEHATLTVPGVAQEELLDELSKTDAGPAAAAAREGALSSAAHTVAAPPPGMDLKVVAKELSRSDDTEISSSDIQTEGGEAWFYEALWRGGRLSQDKERFVKEPRPPPLQLAAFVPKFLGFYEHMGRQRLVLSDLCALYEAPCVADVRVAVPSLSTTVLQGMGYGVNQGELDDERVAPAGGYAVTGYRRWEAGKDSRCEVSDVYGQAGVGEGTETEYRVTMINKLASFLKPGSEELGLAVVHGMRRRIRVFETWAEGNLAAADRGAPGGGGVFGLGPGVSVLLTYDGEDRNVEGNAWLIDFEGAGWRDISTARGLEAARTEARALYDGLVGLRLDLNRLEDQLRRRAVEKLSKRIEKCSKPYAATLLFEVLDKERKGAVGYAQLFKMVAFDPVVRDALKLLRARSKRVSDFSCPRKLRRSFLAAVEAARGRQSGAAFQGLSGESPVTPGRSIAAEDLEIMLWGR